MSAPSDTDQLLGRVATRGGSSMPPALESGESLAAGIGRLRVAKTESGSAGPADCSPARAAEPASDRDREALEIARVLGEDVDAVGS